MMKQGSPARPRAPGALMRAIRFLGGHKRTTAIAYSALIVATLAQLVVPVLVQNMIDTVTLASQTGGDIGTAERLVFNAAGLILLFALLRGAFSFVQAFMAETTSQGLAFDLRNAIFAKIQRLSFSYYDRNQTGQLMIRATDDVERLRTFIAQGLVLAASSFLLLTGALIILAFANLRLTFVVMPLLPIALALFIFFGRVSQPLFAVVQERLSALNTILQENLAGLKVVRAFAREPYEEQRFDVAATNLMAQQLRINQVFSFLFPVIFLVAQLGQVAILYFGGRQILGGTLELGGYQKFSLYLTYVFVPLGQLGFIITLVAQASASARRIFEVLDAQSEIEDKPGALPLPLLNGRVEFRNVTFRYLGTGDPVLKEVSFVAEPGQTIALLGATGSGKTTIINLLPRFYDASEGAVLIDGHDVRDVTLDSLRSQIGIVLQETNLFSGTVRDNIAFGRPEATEAEVEAAARAAAAHSFIAAMPEGYQTKVGERGVTLSGGQKQRIAIARALLLDPRLLILDDSTSSVDLQTEATIQQALDTLMEGRTSVVIAQRISTVLRADQILVLDQGRIAAAGTHAELMEHSPIYAEIYHSQLVKETNL
ncbi:ABC transporter ATP-binding protein [Candidatus Chloroploca sp. M-50]|uniref:ABC transporter ATP-binding protein n=1 Tax=Candidatus Chloroploca mongolica TaxID=2528176 RepID=A0ABS4D988_9CHLR|nr:ABC transporter ATP-binding protein [Candidatus Chloroploca mongolica]MBP1465993.1 ABC transporter ATP-binding protein [Candidatus Chloroploca mongolica]